MKFRLLGIQELLLNDTDHFGEQTMKRNGYAATSGPVDGVLDWSEQDLLELAHYAYTRGEAQNRGYEMTPSDYAEIRSMFGLAARIRKALCKAGGHKTDEAPFKGALGNRVPCPCDCHLK